MSSPADGTSGRWRYKGCLLYPSRCVYETGGSGNSAGNSTRDSARNSAGGGQDYSFNAEAAGIRPHGGSAEGLAGQGISEGIAEETGDLVST